jgi:pentatricopeptide repeat protein
MLCITQSFPVSGAQWEKAVELFDQMQSKGCKPDSVTYGGLILAYEKGDQWRRALAAFDQMKSNNCRPDSVVYNTVVGVLWNTGVVWAQAKAVQVHRHAPVEACSAAKLDWRYNQLVQIPVDGSRALKSRPRTATKLWQQTDKLAT